MKHIINYILQHFDYIFHLNILFSSSVQPKNTVIYCVLSILQEMRLLLQYNQCIKLVFVVVVWGAGKQEYAHFGLVSVITPCHRPLMNFSCHSVVPMAQKGHSRTAYILINVITASLISKIYVKLLSSVLYRASLRGFFL